MRTDEQRRCVGERCRNWDFPRVACGMPAEASPQVDCTGSSGCVIPSPETDGIAQERPSTHEQGGVGATHATWTLTSANINEERALLTPRIRVWVTSNCFHIGRNARCRHSRLLDPGFESAVCSEVKLLDNANVLASKRAVVFLCAGEENRIVALDRFDDRGRTHDALNPSHVKRLDYYPRMHQTFVRGRSCWSYLVFVSASSVGCGSTDDGAQSVTLGGSRASNPTVAVAGAGGSARSAAVAQIGVGGAIANSDGAAPGGTSSSIAQGGSASLELVSSGSVNGGAVNIGLGGSISVTAVATVSGGNGGGDTSTSMTIVGTGGGLVPPTVVPGTSGGSPSVITVASAGGGAEASSSSVLALGGSSSGVAGAAMGLAGAPPTIRALPNPIHVSAGSVPEGADGSMEHPFPQLADAVAAIAVLLSNAVPWDGRIIVHAGRYEVLQTIELPTSVDVEFQAGVTMAMGSKVSLHANRDVKVLGSEDAPVVFTWLVQDKPWGSFTLFVPTSQANVFAWAKFEHGGGVTYQNIQVRGALSLEGAGAHISNCTFQNNSGDDGLSLGKSPSKVDYCEFLNNSGDGIDLDGPGGSEISYCYFKDNGNDGVDVGEGSDVWVHHNVMLNSYDSGIEVGEASTPTLDHNVLAGNAMGIGIRDDANPTVFNNTVYGNKLGITVYQWKSGFGIGQGTISNTMVWGSTIADVAIIDKTAPTKFSYSCIETGAYTDSIDLEGGGKSTPLQGVSLMRKGAGCQDPLFVNAAELDFHLRSLGGHLDSATHTWVNDTETSPCIDAGDPASDYALEPAPNGGRVNLGAYGGTAEASRSP